MLHLFTENVYTLCLDFEWGIKTNTVNNYFLYLIEQIDFCTVNEYLFTEVRS